MLVIFPDTEEVTGSNPVRPTSINVPMRGVLLYVRASPMPRDASPRTARPIGFAIVVGVDEWDIYQTDEVATWLRELQDSDPKTADLVDDAIYTLSRSGPALGRPLVDTSPTRRSRT